MSRRSRKLIRKTDSEAPPKEQTKQGRELLVIAFFFFAIGGMMAYAQRGRVAPLPANHQGPTPEVAAVNAVEMRAYGWLSIAAGFGFVAWHLALKRKGTPEKTSGGQKPGGH